VGLGGVSQVMLGVGRRGLGYETELAKQRDAPTRA
jgi:hypothetical protein